MTNSEPPVVAQRLDPSKPVGQPVRRRHEPIHDIVSVAKDKETSLVAKVIWIAVLGVLFAATVYTKFVIFH